MLALVLFSLSGATSFAQSKDALVFPERTIRLVVPYVPGGLPDTMARVVAQRLGDAFARPVLVDNRPGAGGVIGTEAVARALPDGYTLLVADLGQTAITPALNPRLPYDIGRDFAPVSLLGTSPFFLAVNGATGVTSLKEFIAFARARAGTVSYGSSGVGSPHHLAMEMLRTRTGMDLIHVPYKGSGQSTPAIVAGEVAALFTVLPTVSAHVKAGSVRLLAVASATRTALAADVPTFHELGVKDFVLLPSVGMLAPAGTPRPIIDRLSSEIAKAVRHPDSVQRFGALGIDPLGSTPDAYAVALKADQELFVQAVRVSGAKLE
ncbi:MAG: tripartite tricarboxylate transporter substrate binding protein [Proteobacteria bacterium]|nr:tripartite tricarboxylate transporter substrate binding protein [Burkholderiales bacterium]